MREVFRRLIPLLLLVPSLWAESFTPSQLFKATISGNGPFISLGIVSDSEQQSTINQDGIELRQSIELAVQKMGEEVTPLARAERMKLERLWSLPFTGRISDQLKEEVKILKSGLITGSFSPHDNDDLMLLVILPTGDRTLVFHEKRPIQVTTKPVETPIVITKNPKEENASNLPPKKEDAVIPPPKAEAPSTSTESQPSQPGVFNFGTHLKNSRELPIERKRSRRLSEAKKLESLKLELMGNEILKTYVSERKELSDQDRLATCHELLKAAQGTLLTSSKIEYLRRAFILNASTKSPQKEIEQHTLERLLEHREFFNEPDID